MIFEQRLRESAKQKYGQRAFQLERIVNAKILRQDSIGISRRRMDVMVEERGRVIESQRSQGGKSHEALWNFGL